MGKVKFVGSYHSIVRRCLCKAACEAVDLGRVVLVSAQQSSPRDAIYLFWGLITGEGFHSTSLAEAVVARNPMVSRSLNVPRYKISRNSISLCVLVNV